MYLFSLVVLQCISHTCVLLEGVISCFAWTPIVGELLMSLKKGKEKSFLEISKVHVVQKYEITTYDVQVCIIRFCPYVLIF